jgi:hypothetical protein
MEAMTQISEDAFTSPQLTKDIGERTALQYSVNATHVWCRNLTSGQEVVAAIDHVGTNYVILSNAYTSTQVMSELQTLGNVSVSFDAQTKEYNVSLVESTTCNTYSASETNRAEAYGIVLLKAVEGQELDRTEQTSETGISGTQSVYFR